MTLRTTQFLQLGRTAVGNTNSTNYVVPTGFRALIKCTSFFINGVSGRGAVYIRRAGVFFYISASPALGANEASVTNLFQVAMPGDEVGFYCIAVGAATTVQCVVSGALLQE